MEESPGVGLNLGCGHVRWPGWVNVDLKGGDLRCDIRDLDVLPADHADAVAAIHVLEHFHAWETPDILTEWRRVLKPGGKLILELPCIDKVLNHIYQCMQQGLELTPTMTWHVFWGNPKYRNEFMVHKWGYTKNSLKETLEAAGFRDVTFERPRYHFEIRDMRAIAFK